MIRWNGPLTYEKTQSTFIDVSFGTHRTLCASGVRGNDVSRSGSSKTSRKLRRPDFGRAGPIYRGERRDVRTVSHAAHRKRHPGQRALVRWRPHAVESLVPLALLDPNRASHCWTPAWHRCRFHQAAHHRNLTHRQSSESTDAALSYDTRGCGGGAGLSENTAPLRWNSSPWLGARSAKRSPSPS
jgi:hypothetical protein